MNRDLDGPTRLRGQISAIRLDRKKGFLFEPEKVGRFFRSTSMRDTDFDQLKEGDWVEFTPETSREGPSATLVTKCALEDGIHPVALVEAHRNGKVYFVKRLVAVDRGTPKYTRCNVDGSETKNRVFLSISDAKAEADQLIKDALLISVRSILVGHDVDIIDEWIFEGLLSSTPQQDPSPWTAKTLIDAFDVAEIAVNELLKCIASAGLQPPATGLFKEAINAGARDIAGIVASQPFQTWMQAEIVTLAAADLGTRLGFEIPFEEIRFIRSMNELKRAIWSPDMIDIGLIVRSYEAQRGATLRHLKAKNATVSEALRIIIGLYLMKRPFNGMFLVDYTIACRATNLIQLQPPTSLLLPSLLLS